MLMQSKKGQAIVEFTLMFPLLLLLLGGAIDLGLMTWVGNSATSAAFSGSTVAASTGGIKVNDPRILDIARKTLPNNGFFSGNVVTNTAPDAKGQVTVTVTVPYRFAFLKIFGFKPKTLARSMTVTDLDQQISNFNGCQSQKKGEPKNPNC